MPYGSFRRRSYGQRRTGGYRRSFPYRGRVSGFRRRRPVYRRRFTKRRRTVTNGPERNYYFRKRYLVREKFFKNNIWMENNTGTDVATAWYMDNATIPNFSGHAAGFEQYKIYMWKIEIIPQLVQAPDLSSSTFANSHNYYGLGLVWCYLWADYNDALTTNITVSRAMAIPGVKARKFNRKLSMIIRPRVLTVGAVSSQTVSTSYKQSRGWLSKNEPSVQHYGFKHVMQSSIWTGTGGPFRITYNVRHTVWYGFKNFNAGYA